MNWLPASRWHQQAAPGYRVAAARVGEALRYSAFAPALEYDRFRALLRERYARGEAVPQPAECLGYFDDADAARAACAQHAAIHFPNAGDDHADPDRREDQQRTLDPGLGGETQTAA